jgi:hypothetical protein
LPLLSHSACRGISSLDIPARRVYIFPFPHREYHFHLSCIAGLHFDVVFPSEESKSRVEETGAEGDSARSG